MGVINLVFEKSVEEPAFSVTYAQLCHELSNVKLAFDEEVKATVFRKLLISRCQTEFEKKTFETPEREIKMAAITECTDPEKKKELEEDLDDYDRKLRWKSTCTMSTS